MEFMCLLWFCQLPNEYLQLVFQPSKQYIPTVKTKVTGGDRLTGKSSNVRGESEPERKSARHRGRTSHWANRPRGESASGRNGKGAKKP